MIESRKEDHIDICLNEDVEIKKDYWDEIKLYHHSAPEIDIDDISLKTDFLGRRLDAPIMIAGITGGYDGAKEFNRRLAGTAEKTGIGLGVGSQRPALEDEKLRDSYELIAEYSLPLVVGNIGAPQLISQDGEEPFRIPKAKEALNMIDGDYLAVHFNYLQEAVQPEGDLKSKGVMKALKNISEKVPTIAKETGAGMSSEMAMRFRDARVKALDVGGMGGTSFSAVESHRIKEDKEIKNIAEDLRDWGIPTPVSVVKCRGSVSLPLIATGGIRNGVQIAKALALGADIVGIAGGILPEINKGEKAAVGYIERLKYELKLTMFLLGCEDIKDLLDINRVITGEIKNWLG
ncbi:MAG: type 2 isopentenyl-diphosphate Delta-isomerase [Candidatus Thermoplasmatota archaeon]